MTDDAIDREALLAHLRASVSLNPLHQLLALRVVPDEASAGSVVEMPVRPEAFNSSGNLHGGAIATMIDVAAGTCAARASGFDPRVHTLVTADLHVRYLGRPKGDIVRAEASLVRAGRQLIVVEVRVLDPERNVIAVADFSAMLVPKRSPLRPEPEPEPDPRELDI